MLMRVWHATVGPAGVIRPAVPELPAALLPAAGGGEPEPGGPVSPAMAVARTLAPGVPGKVTGDDGEQRPVRTQRYWRSPFAWMQT